VSGRSLEFVVPGDLQAASGGYGYDRRIIAGLRALGWAVTVHALDGSFPFPTAEALNHARTVFDGIRDRALTLVDGLALGAMPQVVAPHAQRLQLVALVHHPLAAESGLLSNDAQMLERSERLSLGSVRHVVVTSAATAEALIHYGVDRAGICVVRPGTDAAPLARGGADGVVNIVCVATVTPRKGHDVLIDSLASLAALPWRLTCIGSITRSPATADRLRHKVDDAALTERVILAGEARGSELADYFQSADLFALATRHEGYGMAVAEAIARGVPVISTRTGAIPEIVGRTAGLLVPPNDDAAFREALARVLRDPALRASLREGAREARDNLPRWPESCAKMSQVLEGVIRA
jgi:glycosyltransferase involved in cell wall biosynthesis